MQEVRWQQHASTGGGAALGSGGSHASTRCVFEPLWSGTTKMREQRRSIPHRLQVRNPIYLYITSACRFKSAKLFLYYLESKQGKQATLTLCHLAGLQTTH